MKAIIEEGNDAIGKRMQLLALAEGAVPVHLVTALFTKTSDNRLLTNCQLSRHLVGLWTSNCPQAMELMERIFVSTEIKHPLIAARKIVNQAKRFMSLE